MTRKKASKKKRRRKKGIAQRNLKVWLRFLPFVMPLAITAFIFMWLHTRMRIAGLPLQRLHIKEKDLVKQNDSLRLRIEQLRTPSRIESIARGKLRMISPQNFQVIILDEPLNPPKQSSESSRHMEAKLPPGQESTGTLSDNEKRGEIGSTSQASTPPTLTVQPG